MGRASPLKTGSKEGDCETATAQLFQRRHFKTEFCVWSRCAKRGKCPWVSFHSNRIDAFNVKTENTIFTALRRRYNPNNLPRAKII